MIYSNLLVLLRTLLDSFIHALALALTFQSVSIYFPNSTLIPFMGSSRWGPLGELSQRTFKHFSNGFIDFGYTVNKYTNS